MASTAGTRRSSYCTRRKNPSAGIDDYHAGEGLCGHDEHGGDAAHRDEPSDAAERGAIGDVEDPVENAADHEADGERVGRGGRAAAEVCDENTRREKRDRLERVELRPIRALALALEA